VQAPAPGSNNDIQVTVDVTNSGEREGDEVAQLYVREDVSSVETPDRSLAGLSRIHLRPRETKTIIFHVPQKDLAIWNAEGRWSIEAGGFTVSVGGSSQASLKAQFQLRP
jgi:beta-glucosidase